MWRLYFCWPAVAAMAALTCAGCGRNELKVPCAGTVIVDGKPLGRGMLGMSHARGSVPAFVPVERGRFATRIPPGSYDVHVFRALDVPATTTAPAPAAGDELPRQAAKWKEIDQRATPFTLGNAGSSAVEFRMTTK